MSMRSMPFSSLILLALVIVAPTGYTEDDFSRVEIKTIPAAGQVSMLEGAGGNIGVSAGKDGILIVDDQFAPLSEKILTVLEGMQSGPVKFVLNTHWHGDHTGGNEEFGKIATLIAHTNVRKRLSAEQVSEFLQRTIAPKAEIGLPVITFDDSVSIHFNGEEIEVIHFPRGHTDGDSIVFFTKSNVVHMGDHFFNGSFPFVDLESGGSVQGYMRNIEEVLNTVSEDAILIPGHGPLGDVDDLRAFYAMLIKTTDLILGKLAEEMSVDQIKQAGLGAEWESWGQGFITEGRWIDIVYASYTKK